MDGSSYHGEVAGSVLIGMVRAFKNIHLISDAVTSRLLEEVQPDGWYPVDLYFAILKDIVGLQPDMEQLLFHAGVEFVNTWYAEAGGSAVISSSGDFIRLQSDSVGYSAVVRGNAEDVGRLELLELDEELGRAVILSINPFPAAFEQGVLYGGMHLCGDVDYVEIDATEEPSGSLKKKTITIRFRKNPGAEVDRRIDGLIDAMAPDRETAVPRDLTEEIAWKYKTLKKRQQISEGFWQQSNKLLANAASTIRDLSNDLYDRTVELEKALAEIKTLRGIIPICSYCKKIRDEEGSWNQLERYISRHSEAAFSHGICPECMKKHHPKAKI